MLDSLEERDDFDEDEAYDQVFDECELNEEANQMRITPNNKEENLAEIIDLYKSQLVETENFVQNSRFAPNMTEIKEESTEFSCSDLTTK